jgi:hypothetical protein
MDLNGRLRKLEAVPLSARRCPVCAGRSRVSLVYINDALNRPPDPAEACTCGWAPDVVHVVYVEDWRVGQC